MDNEKKRKIFISYKSEYRDFAKQLRDKLQTWGYDTWLDVDDIGKGEYFRDAIGRGLSESDILIGIITPEAIASREVKLEWEFAFSNNGKPYFVPIKYIETQLPWFLNPLQYVDFTQDLETGFEDLQQALENPQEFDLPEIPQPIVEKHLDKRDEYLSNHQKLIKKVQEFWIEGVLHDALRMGQFEIGLETKPDIVLKYEGLSDYTLNESENIQQVFDDLQEGGLLILGDPGSGKTIILLQLAEALLNRTSVEVVEDKNLTNIQTPIVLNLSSWSEKDKIFEQWIIEALRIEYQVPQKSAKSMVENEELILLLDGLDEVAEDSRIACVEAINFFQKKEHSMRVAICSRIKDYELIAAYGSRLRLRAALLLQPLSDGQVSQYLSNKTLRGVYELVQSNNLMKEFSRNPFLLNVMAVAYQNLSVRQININLPQDNEEARLYHLFHEFIKVRFRQAQANPPYSSSHSRHYLQWLAQHMIKHQTTVFYLEKLEPSWLDTLSEKISYYFISRVIIMGITGFAVGAAIISLATIWGGLAVGIMTAVAIFTAFSVAPRIPMYTRTAYGIATRMMVALVLGIGLGLPNWISASIAIVLAAGLIPAIRNETYTREVEVIDRTAYSFIRAAIGTVVASIVFGMMFGLIRGVLFGFVFGLLSGKHGSEVISSNSEPNYGIHQSIQTAIISSCGAGIITSSVAYLALGTEIGILTSILVGIALAVMLFFSFGGIGITNHYLIRFLLSKSGKIPTHYVNFLDYARELKLLRRVGSGYIFVHRYLLEHFAEISNES